MYQADWTYSEIVKDNIRSQVIKQDFKKRTEEWIRFRKRQLSITWNLHRSEVKGQSRNKLRREMTFNRITESLNFSDHVFWRRGLMQSEEIASSARTTLLVR